ncbi:salivary glue protein Sgs-3-like [Dreissena polymorpha]|uniref:salivary glue protein Sgs-3-like n=1 Tax=Dreissena polymorpha TaxID=45954 RepID=UPI0022643009|nr:salivary glue protein Sgs-3-like [Dreissena polymorpha]
MSIEANTDRQTDRQTDFLFKPYTKYISSTVGTTSTTTTTTTTPKPTTIATTTTPTPTTTTTTTPKPTSTTTTTTTPQPTTTTTTTTPTPTTTTTTTPKPTTTTTTTTTPLPTTTTATTTTTPKPTTTPTTTTTSITPIPTTTTSTTTTFKASPIPTSSVPALTEGRIDLCPSNVKGDANLFQGYLGQYGENCLELVPVKTQWHNAQRHCQVAGHGSLIDVQDTFKQDYIVRFLAIHTNVESIWLGLTDSEKEGASAEGKWTWVSDVKKSQRPKLPPWFRATLLILCTPPLLGHYPLLIFPLTRTKLQWQQRCYPQTERLCDNEAGRRVDGCVVWIGFGFGDWLWGSS